VDLVTEGAKPRLVAELGAQYHSTPVAELTLEPDIVIECTGVGEVVIDATHLAAPGAVVALTGISHSERVGEAQLDALNKDLVLGNKVVFGTVNAARRHYDQAADALAGADPGWLARLITRRLAVPDWPAALQKRPEDIKIVVDMTAAG
jgi:glucose 1-dehydrogenase